MKVKIILVDGVIVEADGTAREIADLTAELRRSHQRADPKADVEQEAGTSPPFVIEGGDASGGESQEGRGEDEGTFSGVEAEDESQEITESCSGAEDWLDLDPIDITERNAEGTNDDEEMSSSNPLTDGPTTTIDSRDVRVVAERFRLVAEPTRLQILSTLAEADHNVGELCEVLGGQSQPAVSHHLSQLKLSGLVQPSREGKFNSYGLTDRGRRLIGVAGRLESQAGGRTIELLRQAADPTRLQILLLLAEGRRNVGELCFDLGAQSQPAVSHHLARLRGCGLVEASRVGKFSYYALREDGDELVRAIRPLISPAGGADIEAETSSPEPEEIDVSERENIRLSAQCEPESIEISGPTADRMADPPSPEESEPEADEPEGSTPGHRACRRILLMVSELHHRGYERLRIAPGISSSGLDWRCSIAPAADFRSGHGAMLADGDGEAACYSSGQGMACFNWPDARGDSPAALADKFLNRFPALATRGAGGDPAYARWFAEMIELTAPDGLVYAYADWEMPDGHLPALGCTEDVRIPLPPPGTVPDNGSAGQSGGMG
ncbi:ArsR/SmtB family transcription factor [Tautonia sociabilis]|uniref:ArsR family transcriptional regulator n=1 Tax=Tautonia sociabilis TaxID=2080755 RepID=A0A432MDW0_9BACT|nr:metalloregulator ArsR/SmtB family transcription factor [Tautonia sociabilis]RUL83181.1 ArsR family transcriptional regulator [Tautonia sociabilis]